jgi:hypothetical protein
LKRILANESHKGDRAIANVYKERPIEHLCHPSPHFFLTEQYIKRTVSPPTARWTTQHHTNAAQYNMYFGKSLTVVVVSALCHVSGLATPIQSGGSGYYPAECSGSTQAPATKGENFAFSHFIRKRSCSCSWLLSSALALGFVARVAAPVCVSNVNVLDSNTIVTKHLRGRKLLQMSAGSSVEMSVYSNRGEEEQ